MSILHRGTLLFCIFPYGWFAQTDEQTNRQADGIKVYYNGLLRAKKCPTLCLNYVGGPALLGVWVGMVVVVNTWVVEWDGKGGR